MKSLSRTNSPPLSRAAGLPILVLLLVLASPASAAPQTTFDILSPDFDIGSPVWANITGPGGMAISVRVTDYTGNIIAGRDANLDATCNYSFEWYPNQEGTFNITVTWATGFSLTKPVLIQDKVTSREISDIYNTMFSMERRLREAQAEVQRLTNIAVGLSVVSVIVTIVAALYVRNAAPRPKTELERFLVEDIEPRLKGK